MCIDALTAGPAIVAIPPPAGMFTQQLQQHMQDEAMPDAATTSRRADKPMLKRDSRSGSDLGRFLLQTMGEGEADLDIDFADFPEVTADGQPTASAVSTSPTRLADNGREMFFNTLHPVPSAQTSSASSARQGIANRRDTFKRERSLKALEQTKPIKFSRQGSREDEAPNRRRPRPELRNQSSTDSLTKHTAFLDDLFGNSNESPADPMSATPISTTQSKAVPSWGTLDYNAPLPEPLQRGASVHWTVEEDAKLKNAVKICGEHNWKKVAAEHVPSRNPTQCRQRWQKVIKPGIKKGAWVPAEDELLRAVVLKQIQKVGGDVNKVKWKDVAVAVPGRTHKKCRERWKGHLDPSINHSPFSAQEDNLLLDMHQKVGNRYADIARRLAGRTADKVKSRLRTLLNRKSKGMLGPLSYRHTPIATAVGVPHGFGSMIKQPTQQQPLDAVTAQALDALTENMDLASPMAQSPAYCMRL